MVVGSLWIKIKGKKIPISKNLYLYIDNMKSYELLYLIIELHNRFYLFFV